ncbi:zinc finger protein 644 [Diretmus argenteus]
MSDLKPNAQEDKDVESASDTPGPTQEPLQSHTSSPKNNAAGLSSDEHENPLNGTQPNPFVYSSVPAVPHAGDSLPSGALVNGPASHPTSEVRRVLNKGDVLSNNVLDTEWHPEKDTRPQVLPPPSELQSDAWTNTAGLVLKTLPAQPGVNTPPSDSEENEFKPPYSTLSGDSSDQTHVSQPLINKRMKTSPLRDLKPDWSESSSDEFDDTELVRWDSEKELRHSLWNDHAVDGRLEKERRAAPHLMNQRKRKHSVHATGTPGSPDKVNNSLKHTRKRFCPDEDVDDFYVANKSVTLVAKSDFKYSVLPSKEDSRNTERRIYSTTERGCDEGNDPEDEEYFSAKPEQLKTEKPERDPVFFPCTICNVNFKEKRHLHRHMMYHLDGHNQVHYENVSQPFICRECGRLFCDSNSLMKHIIIHQDRLEKLMEEIKGLKKLENEDNAGSTLQRPQYALGCNCPKTFVQRANTHDNLKHYYCCEECNYITLTQQALEAHVDTEHLNAPQPQHRGMSPTNDAEELDHAPLCSFTSEDKQVLESHSKLEHRESVYCDYEKPIITRVSDCTDPVVNSGAKPMRFKPSLCCKRPDLWKRADFTYWSSKKGDIYMKKSNTLNSYESFDSSQFECCATNVLSPSLWKIDKHGKLSLQPVEETDVRTGQSDDPKVSGSSDQTNVKLDLTFSQGSTSDSASSPRDQATQKSPSRRKRSTPLRSTIDKMNDSISPKLGQRLKRQSAPEDSEDGYDDFSDYTSEATANFLESSENERNPYARSYYIQRQRFSVKEKNSHLGQVAEDDDDNEDDDCSDIQQLIIKEEYIESAVCDESPESPSTPQSDTLDAAPTSGVEHKPCPYCPAVFESGVGLSNHVRGHLHRVGLSYNARHMVSPEQVALQDRRPRIRKRIPTGMRRLRKADTPESHGEHTCPLCRGWFDTKTGLSNHVRGHLKRIGRTATTNNKSPVCVLNELLQDETEHQNILQILNKNQFPSRPFVSQKIISSDGLFLMRAGIQYGTRSPTPPGGCVTKQEAEDVSERKTPQVEAQTADELNSSTLVELLKSRQKAMELQERNVTRKHFNMTKESTEESHVSDWDHEQCDSNNVCIHCNIAFPSAVSLSNHVRAYARRKRIAILEGTSYDYKQKKQRSRPGLKKKILPPLNAEIYRLTCRFCDLVFQGPLSVQEDWIKHLQRHLMQSGVPHSGTGMVEVLGLHPEMNRTSHEHLNLPQNVSSLELPVAS